MNTSPATLAQAQKLLALFAEAKASTEQVQQLLANGELLKQLLRAEDLRQVDRSAFAALLVSPAPQIDWSPLSGSPDSYFDQIVHRNQLRKWGLATKVLDKLGQQLANCTLTHNGLLPVSVELWLGRDLAYNWQEQMLWLADGVRELGYEWHEYFDASKISFYAGAQSPRRKSAQVVGLDLARYWDRENGLVPHEVRQQQQSWPGLSVATLLAFNPQMVVSMDGETVPCMFAPGLVVDSDGLPVFDRCGRGVCVDDYWGVGTWYDASVASFRE